MLISDISFLFVFSGSLYIYEACLSFWQMDQNYYNVQQAY